MTRCPAMAAQQAFEYVLSSLSDGLVLVGAVVGRWAGPDVGLAASLCADALRVGQARRGQ